MSTPVSYLPSHPGWGRLRDALRAVDNTPGPTAPALFGGDDVHIDDDVAAAFAHLTPTPDLSEEFL